MPRHYSSESSETDSDYHDDISYRENTTVLKRMKRTKPTEPDPGPSVRVRTPAELEAAIQSQVEDRESYIQSSCQIKLANRIDIKLPSRV
jgi:hypothetical protein